MHDACRMGFAQTLSNLSQIFQQLVQRSFVAVDLIAQSVAVNVLHGDEMYTFALTDFVDVRDVRMIERGGGGGLLLETAHSISISSNFGRQNLQRDFAMEPQVFRQINFAHATFAEQRADLITIDASIGRK